MTRRIDVIGGGPGGLYAARLIKRARPECQVTVHERGEAGDTFGFGVGLTGATVRNLAAADPQSAADIQAVSYSGHGLELRSEDGTSVPLHGARNLAIARKALLDVLARRAADVGVDIRYGSRVDVGDLGGDVIIAADGARSAVREKLAAELGAHVSLGRGRFLWCGVEVALPDATFAPVRTEHGLFVAHAYPYADGLSTFLVETDEDTWRRAGLDGAHAATPRGESDQQSLRYLEQAFTAELGGRRLLGNRSTWSRFPTVRLRHWHHDNVVLIGDAAHTAHYTLGSGTKLAMEDAIALSENLLAHADISDAFAGYERARRSSVTRFQRRAARSQAWWESFIQRSAVPVAQLAVSFMTRAGNLTLAHFAAEHPQVVSDALASYAPGEAPRQGEPLTDWVLSRSFRGGRITTARRQLKRADTADWVVVPATSTQLDSTRTGTETRPTAVVIHCDVTDPRDEAVDTVVDQCMRAVVDGADAVWLTGSSDRAAALARLATAELARIHTGAVTVVDVPRHRRDDAAAGLVSGRCDLVMLTS